jgi:hypothetical protein
MNSATALTATEILLLLTKKKQSLASAYGLREIGLFGSYADGNASPESDIDLLVDIDSGHKSLFSFIRLKHDLEELLGRKVDLVMKGALKPRLRERILSQVRYV